MKTEKMSYVKPTVQKVEFDFKTRIAASTCEDPSAYAGGEVASCLTAFWE